MAATRNKNRQTPTQARAARRERRNNRKRWLKYGGLAAILSVSLVFILALFLPGIPIGAGGGGGHGGGISFGGGAPDGPGERIEEVGRGHISPGQEHTAYNSVPATSGPHYAQPLSPVRWGVHDSPLIPEEYVHNLEHGGIGIFYDCPDGCDPLVEQLSDFVTFASNNGVKILLAPHSGTGATITLASWTFMDQFEVFDEGRIREFVEAHESSANAPEPFAR